MGVFDDGLVVLRHMSARLDQMASVVEAGGSLPSFVTTDGSTYLSIDSTGAQTRRLLLASHSVTDSSGSCEVIRITCTKPSGATQNAAKGAIAWYLGEDTTPGHAVAWLQAHDYLSDGGNRHQHISIETSDTAGTQVNTRFSVGFGRDLVQTGFFGTEVNVVANKFRVVNGAGSSAMIELGSSLSSQIAPDTTHQRWQISKDTTAEGGSNAGSDLRFANFSDTGVALSTGITVLRASGRVGIGGNTAPGQSLDVGLFSASAIAGAVRINRGTTGQFCSIILASAGAERWAFRLPNDATNDFHIRDVANGVTPIVFESRATQGNITFLGTTKSYGGGVGVLQLTAATTAPTSAPSTGLLLWWNGTDLKVWKSGAGAAQTVTIV